MTNNNNMKEKFIGYFKRTQFGFHVAKAYEWSGSYYGFYHKGKFGYIGGKHNYKQISFAEYIYLKIKHSLWRLIFPKWYRNSERKTWNHNTKW